MQDKPYLAGLIGCVVTAASSSQKGKVDRFDEDGKHVWIDFGYGIGKCQYSPYSVFVMVKGVEYRLEHLMDILELFHVY